MEGNSFTFSNWNNNLHRHQIRKQSVPYLLITTIVPSDFKWGSSIAKKINITHTQSPSMRNWKIMLLISVKFQTCPHIHNGNLQIVHDQGNELSYHSTKILFFPSFHMQFLLTKSFPN